ncbi:MAG: nickel pincer cofactor biosynthesis protein LarB [Thermodesulfovibrionales bacterium]|nr:nickel pincer cofactor biosynthesis protein LarB [Thermodesulfovibrionales bacterium]
MHTNQIINLLKDLKDNLISIEDVIEKIRCMPFEDVSFAHIDHHRHIRSSIPEVIFGLNKSDNHVVEIAKMMYKQSKRFLITKTTKSVYQKLDIKEAVFHELSSTIVCGGDNTQRGDILILSAGTSDIAVAEEAFVTAKFLGNKVEMITDIGVAGIHRLFHYLDRINSARVLIVIAGMEGALPSVVGGLTDKPIVAVPTSTGYGTSLNGITALFAMLNSCAPGIGVVNIDNGFGAACLAHKINSL